MMRQGARQCLSKPYWVAHVTKTTCVRKQIAKPNSPLFHYGDGFTSKSFSKTGRETKGLFERSFANERSYARRFSTMRAPSLEFKVRRFEPVLVSPAKPTPHEVKKLSDTDGNDSLRLLHPVITFYRCDPSMKGKDPVRVIRDAIAQALVFYYPFAGRLKEGPGRKLFVDCTGAGVHFVEAEADVELSDFGDFPRPPFPCLEELIYDAPPMQEIIDSPLLFIQVTRLKCGGFVLALLFNHVMCDGLGLSQFLKAVGELSRGAHAPSVSPIWSREILDGRDPPCVTFEHHLQEITVNSPPFYFFNHPDVIHRSFFFGPSELQAIRKLVPEHSRSRPTTFEELTACIWRCYVAALEMDPEETVSLSCVVNARDKFNPAVPVGYYGNGIAVPTVIASAGELCGNPIDYALELVKRSKGQGTEEYMRSLADLMASRDRPIYPSVKTFVVSDLRRIGFSDLDFGWGKAAYAGVARAQFEGVTFYVPSKNRDGEDGILVPLCLRAQVMDRFEAELTKMLSHQSTN